jgi:hypothetical protein
VFLRKNCSFFFAFSVLVFAAKVGKHFIVFITDNELFIKSLLTFLIKLALKGSYIIYVGSVWAIYTVCTVKYILNNVIFLNFVAPLGQAQIIQKIVWYFFMSIFIQKCEQ